MLNFAHLGRNSNATDNKLLQSGGAVRCILFATNQIQDSVTRGLLAEGLGACENKKLWLSRPKRTVGRNGDIV